MGKCGFFSEGDREPLEGFKQGRDLLGQGYAGHCAEKAVGNLR